VFVARANAKEEESSLQPSSERLARATAIIDECARDSHAGTASFGAIVARLMSVGVESYFADYRRGETTYYLPTGESHSVSLHAPELPIAEAFDTGEVVAAIRGAQQGEVKYPEFVRRTMSAGCVGYFVWIAGRHVRYLGRSGQDHVEHIPPG
jgi:uncharacterized protein YbcV (DUF1398 family)